MEPYASCFEGPFLWLTPEEANWQMDLFLTEIAAWTKTTAVVVVVATAAVRAVLCDLSSKEILVF